MRIHDPRILAEVSAVLKAMSEPTRLALLQELMDGERSVTSLMEAVGTSQANVSKHLSVLRRARLVASRREGMQMLYTLSAPFVREVCATLCAGLADRLDEESRLRRSVRRLLRTPPEDMEER